MSTTPAPLAGLPRPLSVAFVTGAFALGTSENVIAGIMPALASGLSVPTSRVGLLVTAYAGTAVLAGPVLSVATGRVPLRRLTIGALGVYLAGALLAVASPGYATLAVARVLTGALHTTVLVAFMLTALTLAPEDQRGRTVARITLGLGVATVVGVPVGSWLAATAGWRWAFVVIAALVASSLAVVIRVMPAGARQTGESGWQSLRVLRRGDVVRGVAMSALAGLGAMTTLAFAVPVLTAADTPARLVAPLLLVHGGACLAGNLLGGRLADRDLRRALVTTLASTAAALVLATLLAGSVGALAGLALVGLTYFASFAPLNSWIAVRAAGISPDLALAVNSSAFNIGIALAGWAGGAALAGGVAPRLLPALGIAPLACAALLSLAGRGGRDECV